LQRNKEHFLYNVLPAVTKTTYNSTTHIVSTSFTVLNKVIIGQHQERIELNKPAYFTICLTVVYVITMSSAQDTQRRSAYYWKDTHNHQENKRDISNEIFCR
jgi:hypothetical protein